MRAASCGARNTKVLEDWVLNASLHYSTIPLFQSPHYCRPPPVPLAVNVVTPMRALLKKFVLSPDRAPSAARLVAKKDEG
jgi:hypothetical protein